MIDEEVPAALRRLWRRTGSETTRHGRPAELDVDRVVSAAVELADQDGLAGVTLAKVAKPLGVTAMSLYRHVGSKEELIQLMEDHASGLPPELATDPDQWRQGLRRWAYALRAVHQRHPWMADVPVLGPPSGPNALAWMDAELRVLRNSGLDWGEKLGVLIVLSVFVRSNTLMARDMAKGRRDSGLDQVGAEEAYGRAMARLVDAERFPDAARLFASDVLQAPPERADAAPPEGGEAAPPEGGEPTDPDFAFGVELILDGVAAAIRAAAGAAEGETA